MFDFIQSSFKKHGNKDAVIWKNQVFSYTWLAERLEEWQSSEALKDITGGRVVILEADFSPNAVCLFLVLMQRGCILVPLTSTVAGKRDEFVAVAEGEIHLTLDKEDQLTVRSLDQKAEHVLYQELRQDNHPGLVLFSSGSTGISKGVVHDLSKLTDKFRTARKSLRTISFLLYDHIGGVNTMLYTLANGGCLVTIDERSPKKILQAIERYRVELLPVSPTFLNLLILSKEYTSYDLSSLKYITYGTEPMPEATLKRLHDIFSDVQLRQTYGLSEVGILSSQSKASDSLWMKIGGDGYQTRVTDGLLEIKADSAMLGYLNAESPFTEDGWFKTGDAVEVDGEYVRVLGRQSELINVGGEKVYPQEVENVILEMDNVTDVLVYAESNMIMGKIVCAKVVLNHPEDSRAFVKKLKQFCQSRLEVFKIPVKVFVEEAINSSERFKKQRKVPLC